MSGLEIVGAVLGGIPIVIAAIETYRERQSRVSFRRKEPFISRLVQSLNAQHYLLLSDIKMTLTGAGVEYDRSSVQLSPSVFRDHEVTEAVDDYLGADSRVYYEAVDRCHLVLGELVGSIEGLGSMPQGLADLVKTYPSNGGRYQLPKKIRFPMKRDALDRHIRELEQASTALGRIRENMISLSVQVTQQPSSRQLATFTSALNTVRSHAKRLYSAISAAYPTHCHPRHEARLFLQSRSSLIEMERSNKRRKELVFTVLLSPAMSVSSPTPSYKAGIKVIEDLNNSRQQGPGSQPRVTFKPPTPLTQLDPPRTAMDDLCHSIIRARDAGLSLELHLSEGKCLTYCHLQNSGTNLSAHIVESLDRFISLKQLIEDKSNAPWFRNQMMALSLTITSSLMQLVSTPWLRVPITSSSVRFSRAAIETTSGNVSAIPEPFVEEGFTQHSEQSQKHKECSVREYMLELGILLLEIEHWRTLDDFKQELNSGQSPPEIRYNLARRWVEASVYHILPFHLEAITRCVECTFATNGATPNWDDPVFRKSVTEYVLKPLQENCPQQLR
ncbi:hypothetical protein BDW59DRAFT_12256 [Aspergillus cavernicola]|uniref:DUF7580 domain-containing protein n=1 Tax=Aspergillus cavernicola TaxID=176166 RepID=A0ABR4HLH1_9EURO